MLQGGTTVDLGNFENRVFGVRVDTEDGAAIGSVGLELTGTLTESRTEDGAPWSLFGKSGQEIAGHALPAGDYVLRATAYSEAGRGGTALQTLEVSITVTEPEVSITAGTSPVTEGTAVEFTLSRTGGTDAALTVYLSVDESGSMLDGTPQWIVEIEAGSSTGTLSLPTVDDDVVEPSSTVTVVVWGDSHLAVSPDASSAEVEVTDNDTATLTISVEPNEIAEGDDATMTVEVASTTVFAEDQTVTLDISGTAETTEFEVRDGEGQLLSAPYSLTLPAGQSSVTAEVTALIDVGAESAETIVFTASHDGNSIGSATVTIEANSAHDPLTGFTLVDAASGADLLQLRGSGVEVDLGDWSTSVFGLRADPALGAAIGSVHLALTGPVTASATDNQPPWSLFGETNGQVDGRTLSAGSYTVTAKVYPDADAVGMVVQTLSLSFTVLAPEVSIEAVSTRVAEGTAAIFAASRQGSTAEALTVNANVTETAAGTTIASTSRTVTFDPGESRQAVHVVKEHDTVAEAHSVVAVTLTPGTGYRVSGDGGSASVEIEDDDIPDFAVVVERPWMTEGESSTVTLGIRNSVTLPQDLAIALDLADSTAGSADYTIADGNGQQLSAPYNLTLPAGTSTLSLTVSAVDDADAESDESIVVAADFGGSAHRTGYLTISESDQLEPIRLVGGRSNSAGRLEVFRDNRWGTVCDDHFRNVDARVACGQLGFSHGIALPGDVFAAGSGPIWMDDVACTGSEIGLSQCSYNDRHNCFHFEDVNISCGNPTPVVTSPDLITVPANRRMVTTLEATISFIRTSELTWTITGGADSSHFSLTSGGMLTFNSVKDKNSPDDADTDGDYELTVQVTAPGAKSVEFSFTVRLDDADGSVPALVSASVQGATLTLRFSEALDEDSVPPASAFTVTAAGSGSAVGAVSVQGDSVILTLASAVMPNATVTVSYAEPTAAGTHPIQDKAGNDAAAISGETVQVSTAHLTGLTLVDLTTSDTLALRDGTVVDLGNYTGNHFGFRVDPVAGVPVGSVRLQLTGALSRTQTENHPPYSLYGDGGGGLNGTSLAVGEYTLTATAYPERGLGGTALQTLTASFSVTRSVFMLSRGIMEPVAEGEPVEFEMRRSGSVAHMSIEVSVTEGGPGQSTTQSTDMVEFREGDTARMVKVMTSDDSVVSTGGSVTVTIPQGSNYGVSPDAGSVEVDVVDNDAAAFTVSADPEQIEEGGSSTVTVSIANAVTFADDQTIALDLSGGTADAADFTVADAGGQALALPYRLTLPAGQSTVSATITAVEDTEEEAEAETIAVAASHGDEAIGSATVSIAADAAAPDALTAGFGDVPESHDGTSAFTFDLTFSEEFKVSYRTLRDDAFEVTGGTVKRAKRLAAPSNIRWRITVEPSTDGDVVVVLPGDRACDDTGAICDGERPLSNSARATVPGPASANAAPTGLPAITGTARVGETLTASVEGIDDADGLGDETFSYQWVSNDGNADSDIADATDAAYEVAAADEGKALKVRVAFTDGGGTVETLVSEPTAAVAAANAAPTGLPAITGAARVGETLAATVDGIDDADGIEGVTFSYQWVANDGNADTDIAVATKAAYEVQATDLGRTLKVRVAFTDEGGTDETLVSEPTAAVTEAWPEVSIAAASTPVTEGAAAAFVLRRTGDASAALTVAVSVSQTGAVLAGTAPTEATFAAGASEARLSVGTQDDDTAEADARVTARVSSGTGYRVAADAGTAGVDVFDDDRGEASVTVTTIWSADLTVVEYETGAVGAPTADLFSNVGGSGNLTAKWLWYYPPTKKLRLAFTEGIRDVGELELHVGDLSLAFPEDFEGSDSFAWEDVEVDWSGGETRAARVTRTRAAEEPAQVPGVSVADAQTQEAAGAALAFRVTLAEAQSSAVSVRYATSNGTATAGADYVAASGAVRFSPGQTGKTVRVQVLEDAHDEGSETMTLTLSAPFGAEVADGTATGTIVNTDPVPKAWLARFGRTVAGHVVDAVTARFEAPAGGGSHVTLAGQRLALDGSGVAGAPAPTGGAGSQWGEAEAEDGLAALAERIAGASDDGDPWSRWTRDGGARDRETRTMTGREALLGSSFHLALGGEDTAGVRDTRWTAWGSAAASRFDGEAEGLSLDGDVTTFTLGADATWSRWLAGIAVSLSEGEGSFRDQARTGDASRGSGTLASTLTAVHPYLRYEASARLSLWGILGYGTGELDLEVAGGERWTTGTTMEMAAAGARGVLVPAEEPGDLELSLRTDAQLVQMRSDAATGSEGGNLDATEAETSRLRLMLEGSSTFEVGDGGALTPSLEVGLRHDGGDAETGAGVEVGGGLRYHDPASGLTAEARIRGLAAHEDADYTEWGASGSVRIEPDATGRGLSLSLTPTWGAAEGGADRLWSQADARGLAAIEAFDPENRFDAELGYGFSVLGDRAVATPHAGWSRAGESETLTLGQRLRVGRATEWSLTGEFAQEGRTFRAGYGYRLGSALDLNVEASRREAANDEAAEHGVGLRLNLRW